MSPQKRVVERHRAEEKKRIEDMKIHNTEERRKEREKRHKTQVRIATLLFINTEHISKG